MAIRQFSFRELAMIAIILDEEEETENGKKNRRYWTHDALRKRKAEGEYWTLFKHLSDDEEKFFQYFRMSSFQFNELLRKIENDIAKRNTNFRECISPKEMLADQWRYFHISQEARLALLFLKRSVNTYINLRSIN